MKLSVVTINYNNAAGLRKTIESIIPYRSDDVEYIIIDGGSSDGSVDHIKEYAGEIDYWISEPDKGIFNAMNKGMKQAKGDYLLFINSGDTLKQDISFDKILAHLNGEGMIYFNIEMAYSDALEHFGDTYPDRLDFKFFAERSLPHQASFIKRDTLLEYGGYDENMKIGADWAFSVDAVCLKGYTYKHVDDCFSVYFLDGLSSMSENYNLLWEEKRQHIEKNYPLYYSLYQEWREKKNELYKLKTSVSVRYLKKIGLLRWLEL